MRISTLSFQTDAVFQMDQLQSALSTTQAQLATGKSLQSAADNPSAMAQVIGLNDDLSSSQQFVTNGNAANTNLQLEGQALTNATNVLQSALGLAEQAGSTMTAASRQALATQLTQQLQQLVGIANSTDSQGTYLFGGYANTTQPFAQSGSGVTYAGSSEVSQVQIGLNQQISVSDAGDSVFMNAPAGNGTFTTAAAATNTGTGSIDTGAVLNASQFAPDTYTISFTSPASYQITNGQGTVIASGTYSSGNVIAFQGIEVTVTGTPAAGDQFTVAPAGKASVFSTIAGLINTLSSSSLNSAQVTTQVGTAMQQLQGAIAHVNEIQTSVGTRIQAITAANTAAQSNQTSLQSTISQLSDVDYAAAVTQLNTEEVSLQAAQASYASIAKLSLFNYIS